MSNILLQQLLLSILGGLAGALIGALLGGYLSYKGAVEAAKKQTDFLYNQEKEKRGYEQRQQVEVMKHALLAEVRENIALSEKWYDGKPNLSMEAWAINKGYLAPFPASIQEKLIHAYTEVKRFNSHVEYDKFGENANHAILNKIIEEQAELVSKLCDLLEKELSKI